MWFDERCVKLSKMWLESAAESSQRHPTIELNLHNLLKARPAYKNICRKAEKILTRLLINIGKSNPSGKIISYPKLSEFRDDWLRDGNEVIGIFPAKVVSKCLRAIVDERQTVLLCCSNMSGTRGICLVVSSSSSSSSFILLI